MSPIKHPRFHAMHLNNKIQRIPAITRQQNIPNFIKQSSIIKNKSSDFILFLPKHRSKTIILKNVIFLQTKKPSLE